MIVEFLESVSYDHSILLDFIVSPEMPKFDVFLIDYLETCGEDWTAFSSACQELDKHCTPAPSPSQTPYQETTLDKVMDCFTRLDFALQKLSKSNLLPFPVERLMGVLSQVETLYENSSS